VAKPEHPSTLGAYALGPDGGDGTEGGTFALLIDVNALFAPERIDA
jgi:hypothetical protein